MTDILKALQKRYATKIFDLTKEIKPEDLKTILESGRLAPSSFGLEPWQFIVVENKELRQKLQAASYNQEKITNASALIILATRTDLRETLVNELITRTATVNNIQEEDLAELRGMVEGSMLAKDDHQLQSWAKAQSYIALGMMIETAALLYIDSCPMEGFDTAQVDDLLKLHTQNLTATLLLTLGYRGNDPHEQKAKVRRNFADVVTFIK